MRDPGKPSVPLSARESFESTTKTNRFCPADFAGLPTQSQGAALNSFYSNELWGVSTGFASSLLKTNAPEAFQLRPNRPILSPALGFFIPCWLFLSPHSTETHHI